MNVLLSKSTPLLCWIMFGLLPAGVYAQNPAHAPSTTPPGPKPVPGRNQPQYSDEQMQEMVAKLQDRIKAATDLVIGRISKTENDVHLRFSYLRKPERLDPNTFGSKDDITAWLKSVQQLKDFQNNLDKLYSEADIDLGNALTQQRINPAIADQIKIELLKTFPWPVIRQKSELMHQFIGAHEELLGFYDKNWGSWKPGSQPGTATFADASLTTEFEALKDKIKTTGQQIDDQYKVMLQ
jgi:hypothetical protein